MTTPPHQQAPRPKDSGKRGEEDQGQGHRARDILFHLKPGFQVARSLQRKPLLSDLSGLEETSSWKRQEDVTGGSRLGKDQGEGQGKEG